MKGVAPVVAIQNQGLQGRKLTDCECAVKMLPDYADFHSKVDFIQEINFMKVIIAYYFLHFIQLGKLRICLNLMWHTVQYIQ